MEDIIGAVFGELTVLRLSSQEKHPRWNRNIYLYECKCNCGAVRNFNRNNLITGHTKSCGCLKKRYGSENPTFYGVGELGRRTWVAIQTKAKERNLNFEITIEDAWRQFTIQNGKCALTGMDINFIVSENRKDKTASLDRIDNSLGYTKDNIQWVHKDINWMKGTFSVQRFKELCRLVSDFETKSQ